MKNNRSSVKPSDAGAGARAKGRSGHCRELSVLEYHKLCELCDRYARKWFCRHRMPMCDLDDTIVATVENAYERVCRKRDVRNLAAFMKVAAYRAAASVLARRNRRDGRIWIDGVSLSPKEDACDTNSDDEVVEGGFFISDGGEGAERLRLEVEDRVDGDAEPEWKRLFRETLTRQKGTAKIVLRALKKDSRPAVAAGIAGLSRSCFYENLKKIRIDFVQCYRAYREWRAKIRADTF